MAHDPRVAPDAARRRRSPLRARMLTALSGDPDGAPTWVRALADGDDAGYFAEGGPAWTVHSGTATFVAGIRALLVQALHCLLYTSPSPRDS